MGSEGVAEEWRPVVGWDNYEVSSHGRLRSLMCSNGRGGLFRRGEPRPCRLRPAGNGYLRYRLQRNGEQRAAPVHHLVLEAFAGPRPPGTEAAHLNGDRADNRACNLAWVTHTENVGHMVPHGTLACGDANGNAILTAGRVEAARILVAAGVKIVTVAWWLGVGDEAISDILHGRTWKQLPPGYAHADACGVMLALLREASGDPHIHTAYSKFLPDGPGWMAFGKGWGRRGPTEGEAIAAALVALAEGL